MDPLSNRRKAEEGLTTFVVAAVTLVWCTVFLASLYTKEYTPLLYVSGPMAGVIVFVTGVKISKNGNGGSK